MIHHPTKVTRTTSIMEPSLFEPTNVTYYPRSLEKTTIAILRSNHKMGCVSQDVELPAQAVGPTNLRQSILKKSGKRSPRAHLEIKCTKTVERSINFREQVGPSLSEFSRVDRNIIVIPTPLTEDLPAVFHGHGECHVPIVQKLSAFDVVVLRQVPHLFAHLSFFRYRNLSLLPTSSELPPRARRGPLTLPERRWKFSARWLVISGPASCRVFVCSAHLTYNPFGLGRLEAAWSHFSVEP